MSMLFVMNEPTVPLQIAVPKRVRNRLKNAATNSDLTMSELGSALLDWAVGLVETGKEPAALQAIIERAKKEREKAKKAADKPADTN